MEFDVEMISRLLLASFLGGLVGLEREIHGRPAGFRTHLLVSLGACLFVLSSIEFYKLYGNFSGVGPVGVDPGRVAAQVVAGIGFLGAGAIIREKASIRGLTTAACLWVAAAIGIAAGIGLYTLSTLVTVIAVANLLLLKKVENLLKRDTYITVKLWCDDLEGVMPRMAEVFSRCEMEVVKSSIERDIVKKEIFYEFDVRSRTRDPKCPLVDMVAAMPGVRRIRLD